MGRVGIGNVGFGPPRRDGLVQKAERASVLENVVDAMNRSFCADTSNSLSFVQRPHLKPTEANNGSFIQNVNVRNANQTFSLHLIHF